MMKRLLAGILCSTLLFGGCSVDDDRASDPTETATTNATDDTSNVEFADDQVSFDNLNDPKLLQYVEDSVYASASEKLGDEDYSIDSVVATYVSNEYLEELNYNSQENLYFGYKLSDLYAQFEGAKYVFTLGDDGKTLVREFEAYDNSFDKIIKNVAIGTGVILICVTATVIASAISASGTATVSAVLAASAQEGRALALSSDALGAATSGIVTGLQTGNMGRALKSAAVSASEDFKWGAFAGTIRRGGAKALQLRRSTPAIPTPQESEKYVLKKLGGMEQKSYLNGKEVPYGTPGSTRPDGSRGNINCPEAVEVKNYDLSTKAKAAALANILVKQLSNRAIHLPTCATQSVALDLRGRGYSNRHIKEVKEIIANKLTVIPQNIPIRSFK